MEQYYASALLSLLRKGMSPEMAVSSVKDALVSRGRGQLLPKVARAFRRLAEREGTKEKFTLTIARLEDREDALREAAQALAGKTPDIRIEPLLIGGWRLEGAGKRIDRSYKSGLLSLYDRVTLGL